MVKSINTIFMEGDLLLTEKVTLDWFNHWSQHSRPYSRYLWRIQGRGPGPPPPLIFRPNGGLKLIFWRPGSPVIPGSWRTPPPPPPPPPLPPSPRYYPPPPQMTFGSLIQLVFRKICRYVWYICILSSLHSVHIMLLPSQKPSSKSLLKFVYVTSQFCSSSVVHPR